MPSLILIPGLLCDQTLWGAQIDCLQSQADITVADITEQSTVSAMAADLLETAPDHFCLAGFSLGSQVALEIMRIAKDRVKRLALLSATHGGLLPAAEAAIRHAVEMIEERSFDQYLDEAYPGYFAHGADDATFKRVFVTMAHAVGEQAGLRQMRALLAISAPFTNLNRIDCPTVIIGGRDDHRTTPEAHRRLAQEISRSKLVIIDGAAHFTPVEQSGKVTKALREWIRQ
ncbi:MAG: alpha/beta hydrolase [Terriglobales bacterium]|jgi:pimeloyl-ACP methyl ester carboxylesterase